MRRDDFSLPPIAIFLCDLTGVMAQPWAAAGYECYCVDVQHSIRRERIAGNVHFVWGDVRTWRPPQGRQIAFVACFSPCTHLAMAGARDFEAKGGYMLRDGLEMFEAGRQAGAWSGAPYMNENPVGVLSSVPHIGKPDYYFDPYEYTGYEIADNYTKKTCIWGGTGFVMPEPNLDSRIAEAVAVWRQAYPKKNFPAYKELRSTFSAEHQLLLDEWLPDDRIHKAAPTVDRADIRSATPMGFARAVFQANAQLAETVRAA